MKKSAKKYQRKLSTRKKCVLESALVVQVHTLDADTYTQYIHVFVMGLHFETVTREIIAHIYVCTYGVGRYIHR